MCKTMALSASLIAALALTGGAFAGNGGANKSSSSISLMMLSAGSAPAIDGPHWGDSVTFQISTTATTPSVEADCYQNGSLVYTQFGYFYGTSNPPTFTLKSYVWTGGAADCTARLYSVDPKKGSSTTLATTTFHVDA